MMYDTDTDPAFRYESLARAVFDNCSKWGDPWRYAAQDVYNNFVPTPQTITPTLRGRRALSTVLARFVWEHRETDYQKKFKALEDQVWEAQTQSEIIAIIDEGIELARELGY